MTGNLAKVPVGLMQATGIRFRSILLNSSYHWKRSTRPPIRTFSSSHLFRQDKESTENTAERLHEQIQDVAPLECSADAKPHESFRGVSRSGHACRGEAYFDQWVADVLSNSKKSRTRTFSFAAGIEIVALTGPQMQKVAVRVSFHGPGGNALDSGLIGGLTRVFLKIASNPSINGVCLTAESSHSPGARFCSGANLRELGNLQDQNAAEAFIRQISNLCTAIRDTPVPVVALIAGPCIGAGLEMAASCDIRVACRPATFSMPEVLIRIPSVVQARLLCDIVGWGRARHLMLTGHSWTAQEAQEAGLITKLFGSEAQMRDWATDYMKQITAGADLDVYRTQKQLMKTWENQSIDEGIETSVQCFADTFSRPENVERIHKSFRTRLRKESFTKHNNLRTKHIPMDRDEAQVQIDAQVPSKDESDDKDKV